VVTSSSLLNFIAWTPGEANPHLPPPAPKPAPAPVPSVSWPQWPPDVQLQMGAKGAAVRVLQTALRNSGIYGVRGITVDGDFGNQTRTALGNFQAHEGLAEDWIAGPVTRTRLARLNDL
jgi:peptidoglycan hydrolase-like protein with peptidoglycan-binding domain